LTTPGGPLEFGIAFQNDDRHALHAFLVNGTERIEVPSVVWKDRELLLDMPHYQSRIHAHLSERELIGTWAKRRSAESVVELPFRASRLPTRLVEGLAAKLSTRADTPVVSASDLAGRWRVNFETEADDAVALFAGEGSTLLGTFLTSTGDYRYLGGEADEDGLYLSCFDGAHAFLFKAKLLDDGTLAGDFWSGNWHHETWTAKRDDTAELADPFAQTRWNGTTKLADLAFPDLDGTKRSLGDFAGKATLLVVFGSWCPNCNDEAKLLAELDARYRERGLRILCLAFELTGERERDAKQVRIFAERHALTALPFFLCGTADKDEATRALGLVDRVRAFPTTVFVGADGRVRAVHSGYAGPATGEAHQKLRRAFVERIEALLAEAPAK